MDWYVQQCQARLVSLLQLAKQALPDQKIDENYIFKGARLKDISKGAAATQRMISWFKQKIANKGASNEAQQQTELFPKEDAKGNRAILRSNRHI